MHPYAAQPPATRRGNRRGRPTWLPVPATAPPRLCLLSPVPCPLSPIPHSPFPIPHSPHHPTPRGHTVAISASHTSAV